MTDQVSWAEGRRDMYKFLSAVFLQPPTEALLAPILADAFVDSLEEVFGPTAVDDLRRFACQFRGDYEGLDQEFQALFIVPLGRYVTPYEAVYRDEREAGETRVRGLLMGPSTLAVKRLYREAGAAISEDFMDLPDHIGLELACMEFLCEAEARAWDREDLDEAHRMRGFQRRLLHDHLQQWVPALCRRIREFATGPLYRGIARLTEAYLVLESDALVSPAEI
jgi:TorA maturation chaperone TorD